MHGIRSSNRLSRNSTECFTLPVLCSRIMYRAFTSIGHT